MTDSFFRFLEVGFLVVFNCFFKELIFSKRKTNDFFPGTVFGSERHFLNCLAIGDWGLFLPQKYYHILEKASFALPTPTLLVAALL
jgi:hypothetical protein